ncbi:MAG TPA: glycosyltransferase family 39 protein, partial [Elusimicrobiota bacterium]|nr:glycosyltransferase family 39 protein [Elusimicrobiota bacterium]
MKKSVLYLSAAWILLVSGFYLFHQFPPARQFFLMLSLLRPPTLPAAAEAARETFLTTLTAGLFFLSGRSLLRRIGLSTGTPLENALHSIAMGAALFILLFFVLGMLGLWYKVILLGIPMAVFVLAGIDNQELFSPERFARPAAFTSSFRLLDKILVVSTLFVLLFYLIQTLAPETFYDSLVYHLALPQLWLLEHRIVPVPHNLFSGSPMNTELLYALALALSGDALAKLFHYALGIGCLALLLAVGRRVSSTRAGLAAALLFATPPMMARLFSNSAVEYGTAFFSLAALLALLTGLEKENVLQRRNWLLVCGFFCGVAFGTKYTAWALLPALSLGAFVHWRADPARRPADFGKTLIYLCGPAFLFVLPWLLKNTLFFGNPLYPFLHGLFPSAQGPINWDALQNHAESR